MKKEELKEVLFGLLLGNVNLQTYTGGKTWRIKFLQPDKNKYYLFHLYSIFKNYVKTEPKKTNCNIWYFNTITNELWLEYGNIFYKKKKKILPEKNYIIQYLSPLALAYWYMDNGGLKSNCKAYYLYTNKFKLKELKVIGEVFKEKYNIEVSYHKKGKNYWIYIPVKYYDKFKNLIYPYMQNKMSDKL